MAHDHHHRQSAAQANAGRLRIVLLLVAPFMVLEFVAGFVTGSLALIADAGHMLTDVFGVGMALVAISFAARAATASKTFGYYRLEILAALLNSLLLIGIGAYIFYEAYHRFSDSTEIAGWPMLGVAAAGLLVNVACVFLLFEGQKTSLNMRGAFLEVVSDMLGSVAVIVAGTIILLTGYTIVDAIASLAIGLFILPRAWNLTSEALHILLEGSPRNVNLDEVRTHLLEVPGVRSIHDLHVWSMTSGMPIMSAHVVVDDSAESGKVLDDVCGCLESCFDIDHSTIQIEHADRSEREVASH